MSRLLELQERLRTTTEALGRLQGALAANPDSVGLGANIRSLQKLHNALREDFESAANALGMDVCSYRMLEDQPSARSLATSVGTFQDAFSLAFEALRKGPRQRKVFSAETETRTEFRVAYTFPGSFGLAFTIPNERMLGDWFSDLDNAINEVFSIAHADSAESIRDIAKRLGRGPVVAVYDWAKVNSGNKCGAQIEWRRKGSVRHSLNMQYPEFAQLSERIERTGEEETTDISVAGTLVGADTSSHRFHFVTKDTDDDLRGRFSDAISESQKAELPARYRAHIRKTTKRAYSTDEEIVSYFLSRLEPVER